MGLVYNIWVKIEDKLPIQSLTQFNLFPVFLVITRSSLARENEQNTETKKTNLSSVPRKRQNNRGFYNTHFLDQEILFRKKTVRMAENVVYSFTSLKLSLFLPDVA